MYPRKKTTVLNFIIGSTVVAFLGSVWGSAPASQDFLEISYPLALPDSGDGDLPYPFDDREFDKYTSDKKENPLELKDPKNIQQNVEYDPVTGNYNISEKIGNRFYRNPSYLSFDEYWRQEFQKSNNNYWKQRSENDDKMAAKKGFVPKINVGGEVFDRIFGGNTIDIRPQGSAELTFGYNHTSTNNPSVAARQQKVGTFDFRQRIQMNVTANIGDKLKFNTSYNTEATFDFENQLKLNYTGYEDDIIKSIEAGNVSMPLNTTLITGSQSLFGVKAKLQFGRLTVTGLLSQQRGQKQTINIAGNASGSGQVTPFTITGDNYETNRHYFLAQYFKDRYDEALSNLPVVNSPVTITRIEVWVTNRATNVVDSKARNILALMDLGEKNYFNQEGFIGPTPSFVNTNPDNNSNNLYGKIVGILGPARQLSTTINNDTTFEEASNDYQKVENARMLNTNEYTFNPKLGYISLNQPLNNDEVLGVSFQYSIGNKVYTVGELSTNGATNTLIVKLLKSRLINTKQPMWDLMMKNIYGIGAYAINSKDFKLDVLYLDNTIGSNVPYLPEGPSDVRNVPLVRVLNCDKLNTQSNKVPDGVFDFVEGVTINSANGRIIFPVREPFGKFLESKLQNPALYDKYGYDTLYRVTKIAAQQAVSKNRYTLKGLYSSSVSSEISLNSFNLQEGSVTVMAGGQKLVENTDYTVNYMAGKLTIINESVLRSGLPISITSESNALFNLQTKSLTGARFDYLVSKNFLLGGTVMKLTEKPITQKVNVGDEPINNTIFGFDGTYKSDSRLITQILDFLPFYNTKEMSSITVSGEYAQLVPGHARAIGKTGTSYVDDFEGTKSPIDIRSYSNWVLASAPQKQESLIANSSLNDSLPYGYKRGKLSWYRIDPSYQRKYTNTPGYITKADQSDHNIREVLETEIFPNKSFPNGQIQTMDVLNVAYYPQERGPYNFNPAIGNNGRFSTSEAATNWGGMMRRVETTDFEANNIEFIEFWLLDPFIKGGNGGDLYFNIGSISEDILKDSRKSIENGTKNIRTNWGMVPQNTPLVNFFDNDPTLRAQQDVGLDGINNVQEAEFFADYLSQLQAKGMNGDAYQAIASDPAGDDYHSPRAKEQPILACYKDFSNTEANSPINTGGTQVISPPLRPDLEDINGDNTMDETEAYYQYKVQLRPPMMQVGLNNIVSEVTSNVKLIDGTTSTVKWYQFRIPIRKPDSRVGEIADFRSIRFVRMFMHGFEDSIVCRFGRLQFVRSEWRKYNEILKKPGNQLPDDGTTFDVSTINIEENGVREGIPYVLPPGIQRQQIYGTNTLQQLNEQSLLLNACNLKDGDERVSYKNVQLDIRQYNKVQMFAHIENRGALNGKTLKKGDITAFIRLGTDFTDNYYEYEVPLEPTPANSKDPYAIWPSVNEFIIDLDKLKSLKEQRNASGFPLTQEFPASSITPNDGDRNIKVKGTPSLNNIRTIMIGVRNPLAASQQQDNDDGEDKCAEVWVNELRLTDFQENGGWAATGSINAKLADLGNITVSGNKATSGFGSIEQKIQQRRNEDQTQYNVTTSLQMGKFLPQNISVNLPVSLGISQTRIVPLYNPLDPDIKVNKIKDETYRDSVKKIVSDITTTRFLNLTNISKNPSSNPEHKPHFYDISNFNASYAYSEVVRHNVNIESSILQNYKGAVGYQFSQNPKNYQPFGDITSKSKSIFAKPLSEVNFYLLPSALGFRMDADRSYSETTYRPVVGQDIPIQTNFQKRFGVNRAYDLKYDLSKNLKFDFNALNNGIVDEPNGRLDTPEKRDSMWKNFFPGRNVKYHHTGNLNYAVPINKLPYMDWAQLTTRYTADYDWTSGPYFPDSIGNKKYPYGNIIQNSTSTQYNGTFNTQMLFNKVPYFRSLNNRSSAKSGNSSKFGMDKLNGLKDKLDSAKGKDKKKREKDFTRNWYDNIVKPLISIKNVQASYNVSNGTMLNNFLPVSNIMGRGNDQEGGSTGPGIGFIAGRQYDTDDKANNIRYVAARNGWLTKDTTALFPFTQTSTRDFTLKATVEPFAGLRVQLNMARKYSKNYQSVFRYQELTAGTNGFSDFNIQEAGNLSLSFISIGSAFSKDGNKPFEEFLANRIIVSERLSKEMLKSDPNYVPNIIDSTGMYNGYGPTSAQVLIPAFMAAYGGKDASGVPLKIEGYRPQLNWQISYDGLNRLPIVQKYFTNVMLNHAYKSLFNVSSFVSNNDYASDSKSRNIVGDFNPRYDILQVQIVENFSPLIGVDMQWKNSITTRFEYKSDRFESLTLTNDQLSEQKSWEIIGGAGYRINKLRVPFLKKLDLKNSIDLKVDLGVRNTTTTIRQILQDETMTAAGNITTTIRTSADYIINDRFNIRIFFDRNINKPKIASTPAISTTFAGLSLRLTLAP